jgi:ketosteroid isomerase-like protein
VHIVACVTITKILSTAESNATDLEREGAFVDQAAITEANRARVAAAFSAWTSGSGYVTDLLADDVRWTIEGNSLAAGVYESKQAFVDQVLAPFGKRFQERFRPVSVRGMYADGNTVVVLWDGEGVALDGIPYRNAYAWFLTFSGDKVTRAVAFYDSIAFDELWRRVEPAAS